MSWTKSIKREPKVPTVAYRLYAPPHSSIRRRKQQNRRDGYLDGYPSRRCGQAADDRDIVVSRLESKAGPCLDTLIIARTDAAAVLGMEEALSRAEAYRDAGAGYPSRPVDRILRDSGVGRCFTTKIKESFFTWDYDQEALTDLRRGPPRGALRAHHLADTQAGIDD